MIRPPVETLQYIDGEYALTRPPSPLRRLVRRAVGGLVIVAVVGIAVWLVFVVGV